MSPSNVYQSFRHINAISRVFGVMPVKMVPGDRANGPTCRVSKLDYAYSLALLVVSVVHGTLAPVYVLHTIMPRHHEQSIFTAGAAPSRPDVADEEEKEEDEISEMAAAMKILNPIAIAVSSVCSRVVALTYLHRRLGEFVGVLHNADRLMTGVAPEGWSSPAAEAAGRAPLQVLDKHLLSYFAVVAVPVNVYYVFTASAANSKAGTAWCLVLIVNNLACFSADLQFVRCASMLEYRFRVINNELETVASAGWRFTRGALVRKKTCQSFLSELSYGYGYKICDSIEMYRYCHGQFCNLVCQLNSTYQLHLLGSISACFLKVLFNVYFSMFGYVVGTNGEKEYDELVRAICWNIFYGIRFLTIIYAADTTSKQAVNAKTLLTDINNRYLDSSTKEELQLFYTQISSRSTEFTACDLFTLNAHLITSTIRTKTLITDINNRYLDNNLKEELQLFHTQLSSHSIEFTPYDLFTLNTRLITSAIAAGATYLVILVQFHSNDN